MKVNLSSLVSQSMSQESSSEEYAELMAKELRKYIQEARSKQGLSQRSLAKKAGITQKAISTYESGLTVISLPSLFKITKALGIDIIVSQEE